MMFADSSTAISDASSSSSNTVVHLAQSPSHEREAYTSAAYSAKGKRRATGDDLAVSFKSDDTAHLVEVMSHASIHSAESHPSAHKSSTSGTPEYAIGRPSLPGSSTEESDPPWSPRLHTTGARDTSPPSSTLTSSSHPRSERERRTRKGRDSISRSLAPNPLRSALTPSPTTGSASQFVSLLGQPVAVSAALSAPDKSSTVATSAMLPSLYKASRGRSDNVSPSRRWDRRGASASVLSSAGATSSSLGVNDSGDQIMRNDQPSYRTSRTKTQASSLPKDQASVRSSTRRLSVPREEALFPSDEDDSPQLSPSEVISEHADKVVEHRRRSRRWSSIERERRRGMRILLQDRPTEVPASSAADDPDAKVSTRGRSRLAQRILRASEEDASDLDSSSSPSSCTSSCDLHYVVSAGATAAIPIQERRDGSTARSDGLANASLGAASSQSQVPSSTDGSDDPSPAASTPSTSLVQRSPPGFTALKPILAIPVASESDPLLGLSTPSVEDMIQVDKVEFFPEEAITAQLSSATVKRKTSPKRSKKSSWIIGDFESEPESDDEKTPLPSRSAAVQSGHSTSNNVPTPNASAGSYQARLASLQSQLRIWSRNSDSSATPRVRQTSSSSEDHTEGEDDAKDADSGSSSLLSASWRNLTRLPNLILLPGLAARQARESLAAAPRAQIQGPIGQDTDRASPATSQADFAQIYRLASSGHGPVDEKSLQAQRNVALKTGRPPSPSPSPSPPASLLGSRQSSNDSISASEQSLKSRPLAALPRGGRGVASPLEADRDPSAYVSGLGQPIDPDTELSSVVQLQTFRSRSRSRPADVRHRSRPAESSSRDAQRQSDARSATLSPKKLGQPIELAPSETGETAALPTRSRDSAGRPLGSEEEPFDALTVQIPRPPAASDSRLGSDRRGPFAEGPAPTDTASAPTSPTFRKGTSSSASSADETDNLPSPPSNGEADAKSPVDADGFRVVRRRHRRRSSGPRSLRPKVDAPVPQGYSAFAIKEDDENAEDSDTDGEVTPPPGRTRSSRARRGRDASPRRSTRQCAVGLFGGGVSAAASPFPPTSRTRRSSRREASQQLGLSTPIRTVRSSPDLTYAAAVATRDGEAENEESGRDDPSPPRGSRGRRGAVKVVASSVGQRPSSAQPLLGGLEGLRRGPSYPPRAGEIFDDTQDGAEDESLGSTSFSTHSGRGRSASSPICSGGTSQALRFRLLSNSSHLLMLSLELDMIKKQKISAPLKPRWGKHRANDFNPLPFTVSYSSSYASSKYLRSPFSGPGGESGYEDADCSPCGQAEQNDKQNAAAALGASKAGAGVSTIGGGLRDPSSRLRYSWNLADIAAALEAAPAPMQG